jgi:hypothetical protein
VVVEHDRRHAPEDVYGAIERADRRRYGDTEISFFRRAGRPGAAIEAESTDSEATDGEAAQRNESPADEPAQPEESPDDDA